MGFGSSFGDFVRGVAGQVPVVGDIVGTMDERQAARDANHAAQTAVSNAQYYGSAEAEKARQFEQASADKQMAFQKESQGAQMAFEERMSSSAYQRSQDDLRKAGLNPLLAVSQGGASTPSVSASPGASASSSSPTGSTYTPNKVPRAVTGSLSNALDLATLKKEIGEATSRVDVNKALKSKIGVDKEVSRQEAIGLEKRNYMLEHVAEMYTQFPKMMSIFGSPGGSDMINSGAKGAKTLMQILPWLIPGGGSIGFGK